MNFYAFRENYAYFYLSILLLGGILTAVCKYIGIIPPISFLSLILLLSFPIFFVTYLLTIFRGKTDISFLLIGFVALIVMGKSIFYLDELGFASFINIIYYFAILLSVSLCFGLNKFDSLKLLRFIYFLISILSIVGVIQFFFHSQLPKAFVELPVIKSELAKAANSREIEEFILFSMNGLFNNTIVYGSILLIPLTISLHNILNKGKVIDFIIFLLSFIVIIMLVSRVNIASAFFIIFCAGFSRLSFKSSFLLILSVFFVLIFIFDSPIAKLIVDRFTGKDEWASVSNDDHYSDYMNALNIISDNFFLGINFNDYISKDIITDGTWFVFALDLGSLSSLIVFVVLLYMCYKFFLIPKHFNLPNFGPLYLMYIMGGWFNSFLIDKASFSLLLIIYSLCCNVIESDDNV